MPVNLTTDGIHAIRLQVIGQSRALSCLGMAAHPLHLVLILLEHSNQSLGSLIDIE